MDSLAGSEGSDDGSAAASAPPHPRRLGGRLQRPARGRPSPQSVAALLLREDLLQLRHPKAGVLVDVGWYGDADSGEFAVYVQAGNFRGERLHEFRSRDRLVIVAEVERLLCSPGHAA